MKKIFLYIIGVFIFIVVVGLLVKGNKVVGVGVPNSTSSSFPSANLKTIKLGSISVKVAVAKSEDEKRKGLSGISLLPQDQGMIFDYNGQGVRPAFWMKDMLFPLDFVWIKNGKVIEVDPNAPQPASGTKDADLKIYIPKESVDYVLEVNSGFSQKNNVNVGTLVDLSKL